jgi:uncharacterized LabA/DUF88 family protein
MPPHRREAGTVDHEGSHYVRPVRKDRTLHRWSESLATSKSVGFDIDYRKLLAAFQKRACVLRAYYYTAVIEDLEFSSIRPLIDWLVTPS